MPDGAKLIDPDLVAGRIAALLRDRRAGAVRPLLAALEKLAPEHPDLVLLRVSYCCLIQDTGQALNLLEEAIALQPANPMLHLTRSEIWFGRCEFARAAEDAAEAVLLAPALARAKSVLGLALLKLGRFDAALPCLAESFAADPAGVDVALALAALAPEDAAVILERAIVAAPSLAVLRNALTRRYLCAGDIAKAGWNAAQTRADGLADAETFCLLAFVQMQENHWEGAGVSVAQARSLTPEHPWAARLEAALAGRRTGRLDPVPQRDGLAAEQALISGGIVLPGKFRALLEEAQRGGEVLDLFCGTGLNAIAAQDVCRGPWTGVEPDPVLGRLAAERGLYARLEQGNPLDFLAQAAPYPVILLNEALAYAESPLPWLDAVQRGLAPGGIALAAIPTGRAGLSGHGLFAHGDEQIVAAAARSGLAFSPSCCGVLRHIEGIPLRGVVASFRKL